MGRPRHPNKHIEQAIQYAENLEWTVELSNGHAWGHLYCTHSGREGCRIAVWSTPRIPENHARHIRREVDICPHGQMNDSEDSTEGDENGT